MMEITIYGRGGQGGVTLAKLISAAYFLRGKEVQAFGVYAAERSGAPLQAFVRIDDAEITNHNQVHEPDHVVVLDRTLIGPHVSAGLKPDGWLILNSTALPGESADLFPGRRVATIDATAVAVANGLGTRTVPIVNTTMLGAVAKVLDLELADVTAGIRFLGFGGANLTSAQQAYQQVVTARLRGRAATEPEPRARDGVAGILDAEVGGLPTVHTGDWATRRPGRTELTPPCNDGCPAGNDVRGFVQAVARKEYDAALSILLRTSPFPSICGRVCPAPCMEACNRRLHDEAVDVRELERYAGDHGTPPEPPAPTRAERVAVVGSGPAGLSATYHLARLGYRVTLLEAGREVGGVLRTGIPPYRLPRDVLDREIGYILRHGVEVGTGHAVNRQRLLELSHQFAAVFVATGLQESRALDLGRVASDAVVQGIDFLDRVRQGKARLNGERIVVIGGGNTAVDAARSARRIGAHDVQIVYRRTRAEMPAIKEEVDEALEEGIALRELALPLRLHTDAGGSVLTCQRMELGEPDASGRRAPVPVAGADAQFELCCDRIILALGQTPDLSLWPEGADVRDGEALLGVTGAPIFAGGDLATGDGTVTAAVGSGRRAALHVHRTLTGEDLFPAARPPVAGPDHIALHLFSHAQRERGSIVPATVRCGSFAEVRLGLRDEPGRPAAALEAARCLSCGVCNECDNCRVYCPEGVMVRSGPGEYAFDYDYCKGCGICAAQCPRGVVYMAEL